MSTVHISPAANADLDELADYLAGAAGIETAIRFFDAAAATFESIYLGFRAIGPTTPGRLRSSSQRL